MSQFLSLMKNNSNTIQNQVDMISGIANPLFDWYHQLIEGEYLAEHLRYPGGKGVGVTYINKVQKANRKAIEAKYDDSLENVRNPTFWSFAKDNLLRLALNPFDRLVTAYQAYPELKARFHQPGTLGHTMTQIMNQGVIFGAFKGFIFNFAQFGLILYPSVYFANKNGSESKFMSFLATYTFLDTLFYPLDTLRTALYADTLAKYNIKTISNQIGFNSLYKGIFEKLAYNIPLLSGYYCTTQSGYETEAVVAWAIAALLYPLNTAKVRRQVEGTPLSSCQGKVGPILHSSYRGVIPYILLNAFIGYSLRPLFSSDKLASVKSEVQAEKTAKGFDI